MENLGQVSSWREVFRKAGDLYGEGKIDTLATVSLSEFKSGKYWGQFLDGRSGLPQTGQEALTVMEEICPMLYKDNTSFHLFHQEIPITNAGSSSMLVVVYLKQDEVVL
ncbi:MAG: hypothetical protein HY007_03250 [Candidatus Sungbacteria bacterium]|nr:hypothetical protein [Candidatus Sungbacteria bacterium]